MEKLYESLMPDLPKQEDATPNSFSSPGNNAELSPGQIKRMKNIYWRDEKLRLKQLALIHMFEERCEKIQLIIQNIANTFFYNQALINKIECCRMYDQTYEKIDSNILQTELANFKSNRIFPKLKQIIQAEISKKNTYNVASILQGVAPVATPRGTQESKDCCSDDGTNFCANDCYIVKRVIGKTKYFKAKTSKCERRYGNIEHVGEYTINGRTRKAICKKQYQDSENPGTEDELTEEELVKYKINIQSAGKTPNSRPKSLSKSKTAIKTASNTASNTPIKTASNTDRNTLLKIVINYLLFICKMLTYHKNLLIDTSEKEFEKLIKKPRKQRLYLDISNKLDELNIILDEVEKSKGGASYTRKKQRKKTHRKSRRKQCRKSRKKC